mgnify:CR=1 FL=1
MWVNLVTFLKSTLRCKHLLLSTLRQRAKLRNRHLKFVAEALEHNRTVRDLDISGARADDEAIAKVVKAIANWVQKPRSRASGAVHDRFIRQNHHLISQVEARKHHGGIGHQSHFGDPE